jgi:hypothetical protein
MIGLSCGLTDAAVSSAALRVVNCVEGPLDQPPRFPSHGNIIDRRISPRKNLYVVMQEMLQSLGKQTPVGYSFTKSLKNGLKHSVSHDKAFLNSGIDNASP